MTLLDKNEVRDLYDRTSRFYDAALWLYRITGVDAERRKLVAGLNLSPGDTVVDLCCGTGANLPALFDAVGPQGRILGIDISDGMLDKARHRVARHDWGNVDLIEGDAGRTDLPPATKAVLSTFGMEMVPEYDDVIRHIAGSLSEGARFGLLGLKHPEKWPRWLIDIAILVNKPFGVNRAYEELQPWRSVERHLRVVEFRELYAGAGYVCIGEKR